MLSITAFYAALLAVLFLVLSVRVIGWRRESRVEFGHGEDSELLRRMRVHANFAEYVPFTLLLMALACELMVTPPSLWMSKLVGHNSLHCLSLIPLFAIGPLAALLYALRQGAPARPGLAGVLAGLAASGIAAIFYATNCTDDSPLFVATWYSLATAIVAGIGYVAGSRLLRW